MPYTAFMRRAIVLFARSPEHEAAAKRLPAAALFRSVVAAWLDAAQRRDVTPVIACADGDRAALADIAPQIAREWIAQTGGTFGQRVTCAANEAFARFDHVLIAAIDAPPRDLDEAFAALDRGIAVVSPSRDGGINYIGLTAPESRLLERFAPRRRDVLRLCRRYFASLVVVGGTIDVDDAGALEIARGDRVWRAFLPQRPVARTTAITQLLRGVTHQHRSRPPPVSS